MQGTKETNACPRCTHANTADNKYCGYCGLHIDGLCPDCNTQNSHSIRYCESCRFDFTVDTSQSASVTHQQDLRNQYQAGPSSKPAGAAPSLFRSLSSDCPRCHQIREPHASSCGNCGLPFNSSAQSNVGIPIGSIPAYVSAKPGGFWVRSVSLIIDSIVSSAAISALILIFTDISPSAYFWDPNTNYPAADFINWTFSIVYAPLLLGIWSTTIGKRALNMYVVRLDGARISFWRAFGREFAKIISFIPLGAGFWMVAFRQDRRALHDLIAGTVVVQR